MLSRLPFPGPVAALESLPALFPVSALHTYCSFITASLEREGKPEHTRDRAFGEREISAKGCKNFQKVIFHGSM
jgi:hypothetical protein